MHFSTTLIALLATTVFALPGQQRGADQKDEHFTTPCTTSTVNAEQPPPPPPTPLSTNSAVWKDVKQLNGKPSGKPPVMTVSGKPEPPMGPPPTSLGSPPPAQHSSVWSNVRRGACVKRVSESWSSSGEKDTSGWSNTNQSQGQPKGNGQGPVTTSSTGWTNMQGDKNQDAPKPMTTSITGWSKVQQNDQPNGPKPMTTSSAGWSNVKANDEQGAPRPMTTSTSGWNNVKANNNQGGPQPMTTTSVGWSNVKQNGNGQDSPKPVTTTAAWSNVDENKPQDNQKSPSTTQQQEAPKSPAQTTKASPAQGSQGSTWGNVARGEAAPSPNPAFSPAGKSLPAKLGPNPSDICTWEFILTCMDQAYTAGDVCLHPLEKASTNCFSDNTCAKKIGNNAPSCAACYNKAGKQTFVSACFKTQSDANVKPVFQKLVSAGICNSQGVVSKA